MQRQHIHLTDPYTSTTTTLVFRLKQGKTIVALLLSYLSIQSFSVLVDSNMKWALVLLVACQSLFCWCYCDWMDVSIMDFIMVSATRSNSPSLSLPLILLSDCFYGENTHRSTGKHKHKEFDSSTVLFSPFRGFCAAPESRGKRFSSCSVASRSLTIWNEECQQWTSALVLQMRSVVKGRDGPAVDWKQCCNTGTHTHTQMHADLNIDALYGWIPLCCVSLA